MLVLKGKWRLHSNKWSNSLKVAGIYVAAVTGAGFASGQEILQFFSVYKRGGFYGILFSGVLFALIGCLVLKKVHREKIENYEQFLFPAVGPFIGWFVEISVTVFMLLLFCIMITGSANVILEMVGFPLKYGIPVMGFAAMLLIMSEIRGVVMISSFTTPIIIIGIVSIGVYVVLFAGNEVFSLGSFIRIRMDNWFVAALLYVCYNSLLTIVVMCSLLRYLKSPGTAMAGGILGGVLIGLAALIMNMVIAACPGAEGRELPVLHIVGNISESAGSLYAVLLWLAMLVSAATSGFCFSDRVSVVLRLDRRLSAIIMFVVSVPLSMLGFAELISVAYPLFGYVGLFLIAVIIIQWLASYNSLQK